MFPMRCALKRVGPGASDGTIALSKEFQAGPGADVINA
jgi:hypothetical protein